MKLGGTPSPLQTSRGDILFRRYLVMASGRNAWWVGALALVLGVLGWTDRTCAAERDRLAARQPAAETVELFAAMEQGLVEAQLIPKDSTQCRLLVKNKTNKPLSVKLPEAFAGVPVLAQAGFGPDMGAGGGRGRRGGAGYGGGGAYGGGAQGFGGGFGGMGGMGFGGMGMGGWGGGFMNVPPERIAQAQATTVCLDHGKPDPRPGIKYEIKPIEAYTSKPAVHELVRMLGRGEVPQRVAQVAAWHLNNDMTWEQLAAKELRFATGLRRPYFTPQEIQAAMQVVAKATNLAEQRRHSQPQPTTPSASNRDLTRRD